MDVPVAAGGERAMKLNARHPRHRDVPAAEGGELRAKFDKPWVAPFPRSHSASGPLHASCVPAAFAPPCAAQDARVAVLNKSRGGTIGCEHVFPTKKGGGVRLELPSATSAEPVARHRAATDPSDRWGGWRRLVRVSRPRRVRLGTVRSLSRRSRRPLRPRWRVRWPPSPRSRPNRNLKISCSRSCNPDRSRQWRATQP